MRAPFVFLLCALAIGASAQEETCAQEVAAAVAPLKSQTVSLTGERDKFQSEVTECREGYSKLYKSWQTASEEADSLKANVADLTSKLSTAEEKLSKASAAGTPKMDLPAIATALVGHAKDAAVSAAATGKVVFEELKAGKTDRLTSLLGELVSCFRGAASSTVAFIKTAIEEHLPEPVKKQIGEQVAKAQALWKEHVTDAAWAQPVLKQLGSVNEELKKVVTKALSSHPVLASLADPVTVQLFAYSVFALPVLVLLVLPFALIGGKKPSGEAPAAFGKKKRGGKGRA